jgi:hypothetical protein
MIALNIREYLHSNRIMGKMNSWKIDFNCYAKLAEMLSRMNLLPFHSMANAADGGV